MPIVFVMQGATHCKRIVVVVLQRKVQNLILIASRTKLIANQPEKSNTDFTQVKTVTGSEVRVENHTCEHYSTCGPKRCPDLVLPIGSIQVSFEVFSEEIIVASVTEPL